MDIVGPEQVGPVPDRVEPVREHDTGVPADEGGERGVDLLAPLVGHVGVDEHQCSVRPEQPHQLAQFAGGDDVVGAQAHHHNRAQPAAVRQAAHHVEPGRHLPARQGVDVDSGQHVMQRHGTGRHDRIADRGDLPAHHRAPGGRSRGLGGGRGGRPRCACLSGLADPLTPQDLYFHGGHPGWRVEDPVPGGAGNGQGGCRPQHRQSAYR
jgi:hypothetical protein